MPYSPAPRTVLATALAAIALTACTDPAPTSAIPGLPSLERAGDEPGTHRQYGTPIQFGNGRARSYVVLNKGVPVEVGLALDERAR